MGISLRRRVALVTGAGGGIGGATAHELVSRGASVALLDRDISAAERVAAELGSGAVALEADVTDRASVDRAVDATVRHFGGIDIVVANAGISGPTAPIADVDPDAFERVIDINLLGTWRTVRAALPFVLQRRGFVLGVASMAAALPGPTMSAYSTSKSGIEAFCRALRLEVATSGVGVGVAYFGLVDTELIRDHGDAPGISRLMASFPGAMSRPIPPAQAAQAIVSGIENRRSQVYAPGWVRPMVAFRGQAAALDRLVLRIPAIAAAIGGSR